MKPINISKEKQKQLLTRSKILEQIFLLAFTSIRQKEEWNTSGFPKVTEAT